MKSTLFSRFDLTDEENKFFVEAMEKVLSNNRDGLLKIIQRLPEMQTLTSRQERINVCEELSDELGVEFSTVNSAINVFNFFASNLIKNEFKDDTAEQIVDDLISLNKLKKDKKDLLQEILELIIKESKNSLLRANAERKSKLGVLPSFTGISTSVELRAIIEREIDVKESLDEYLPILLGYIPIVSISIHSDDENNSNYFLQATIDETKLIIRELQAAIKISEKIQSS